MQPVRVGVVGCGMIAPRYVQHALKYPSLKVVACADLDRTLAENLAAEAPGARAMSPDDLLADPSIQIVLNLTSPKVHETMSLAALKAGKHVYSEKPLAIDRRGGRAVLRAAERRGLRVGCAPDTFLGAGLQTCRKLIDEGAIGRPIAATAFMVSPGPEGYHVNPHFLFKAGGGPVFDMGPYYLTALTFLLGSVRSVSALVQRSRPTRTVLSHAHRGQTIDVEIDDHVIAVAQLDRPDGPVDATLIFSWAGAKNPFEPIVIFGTEGMLRVPDPNGFDGEIQLGRRDADWQTIAHTHATGLARASGLAEMAEAISQSRPHRASGALAYGVLDVMVGLLESGKTQRSWRAKRLAPRPEPLPAGLAFGRFS